MNANVHLLEKQTVLFAEDDIIARTQIAEILSMLVRHVYVAEDGEEALKMYEEYAPDMLVTDIKMPKRDGISLIRQIRKDDYNIPVILMTSYTEQNLLISAANLSIDGFLVKPIDLKMLTAALGRASQRSMIHDVVITLGDHLHYNMATKMLYGNGDHIVLGTKEQELLHLLVENRKRTVRMEEISQTLWPWDSVCSSAIKNIVLRLRKKLQTDVILSVRGVGYHIATSDAQ